MHKAGTAAQLANALIMAVELALLFPRNPKCDSRHRRRKHRSASELPRDLSELRAATPPVSANANERLYPTREQQAKASTRQIIRSLQMQ
jgi:hypothetical protein